MATKLQIFFSKLIVFSLNNTVFSLNASSAFPKLSRPSYLSNESTIIASSFVTKRRQKRFSQKVERGEEGFVCAKASPTTLLLVGVAKVSILLCQKLFSTTKGRELKPILLRDPSPYIQRGVQTFCLKSRLQPSEIGQRKSILIGFTIYGRLESGQKGFQV